MKPNRKDVNNVEIYNGSVIRWTMKGKGKQAYMGVVNYEDGEWYAGGYPLCEIVDPVVIK
jgi:hypothetical protein